MPRRSKVLELPDAVRSWLDKALAEKNFGEYELLAELLKDKGFSIGKSSLHRYGSALERKMAAIRASTDAARAIAEAAPDERDDRSAAVMSLVQTDIFEVLLQIDELQGDDALDPVTRVKTLASVAKSIAQMSRASVNQKKWVLEVRARAEAAAAVADKIAQKGGLSEESAAELRRAILGIAA